jgi:hypothetical protein
MDWSEEVDVSRMIIFENSLLIPKELGCYRFLVRHGKYDPKLHGPSPVIYIGGMKPRDESSLRKRLGEFICAAMGFPIKHSGGHRFFDRRTEHLLTVHDLLVQYIQSSDPICAEVDAFDEFENEFRCNPLLNEQRPTTRCPQHQ